VNHADIKNIESIRIDPKDPNVVYAGLAPGVEDRRRWLELAAHQPRDDRRFDVFSIIVTTATLRTVLRSACSGIYKSLTAGDQFHKDPGHSILSRRTRVLHQDPTIRTLSMPETTEGSEDDGPGQDLEARQQS